jgi:uncharacterized membrane protein
MALVVELKGREGASAAAIGLVVITLAMAWVVFNVRFALHDAHLYYVMAGGAFRRITRPMREISPASPLWSE